MDRALHITIILAVAAHTVLGCCWHHAHAAGSASYLSIGAKAMRCACEHNGHRHERPTGDYDHEKEHGCGEHACIFTRSDAPEGKDLLAALQDVVTVSLLPAIAGSIWTIPIDRIPSVLAASTPLYLLNQILLI